MPNLVVLVLKVERPTDNRQNVIKKKLKLTMYQNFSWGWVALIRGVIITLMVVLSLASIHVQTLKHATTTHAR